MKTTATFVLSLAISFMMAQDNDQHLIIQNATMSVHPSKVKQFETAVTAHNKKYHADETYGARIYTIGTGPDTGKYVWNMGPIPWSAYDSRPKKEGHDEDWDNNVVPHFTAEGNNNRYWRFHPELSNFTKDFELNVLYVTYIDVARFKTQDMMKIMEKVQKTNQKGDPDFQFGVYANQFRVSGEGMDFAFVGFMDNWGKFQDDDSFPKDYEAVYGAGSFPAFLEEIKNATVSISDELWVYRKDLSGKDGKIKVQQ